MIENTGGIYKSVAIDEQEELAAFFIINATTFVTVSDKSINYDDDWTVYSRCSNHMTGYRCKLSSMFEYTSRPLFVTANNSRLPITHIGKMVITSYFSYIRLYRKTCIMCVE